MNRYQNIWLLAAVIILLILPLLLVSKPEPGQKEGEIFSGADGQAKDLVVELQPNYEPWFEPILSPPSSEVESLLFALQAALGAGFLGYYLGSAVTAARLRQKL